MAWEMSCRIWRTSLKNSERMSFFAHDVPVSSVPCAEARRGRYVSSHAAWILVNHWVYAIRYSGGGVPPVIRSCMEAPKFWAVMTSGSAMLAAVRADIGMVRSLGSGTHVMEFRSR